MKFSRNKTMATTLALSLLLTISAMLAALPITSAHDPAWEVPTWAFLSVAPNPAGVGQTVYVNFWLDKVPPTANSAYGDRWHNMEVTVTKPDQTSQSLGKFTSDAVGGAWTTFTPATVGTYTFVFEFPGQTITGENPSVFGSSSPETIGDHYSASTSDPVTLTVQQDQVPDLPNVPLPTDYWTRPIPSLNSAWYQIGGNWLGLASSTFAATGMYNASGNFNPYTTAPNSAHLMWTKTLGFGGLIGGEYGGSETANYYSTSQYEPKFAPIIMNGILYYTEYVGSSTYPNGWEAVDLRTGETIWHKDTTTPLSLGQIYNYVSPNQYGALAYLWTLPSGFFAAGGNWGMYDANTGDLILEIENGQSVTRVSADDGSLLGYYANSTFGQPGRSLTLWNSSKCILDSIPQDPFYTESAWMWRPPQGATFEFDTGVEWSVPIPTEVDGVPIDASGFGGLGISKISGDTILMTYSTAGFGFNPGYQIEAGFSATDGSLLWGPINRTVPAQTAYSVMDAMNGVYTTYTRETMEMLGFNLTTGTQMWGPVKMDTNSWGYYGVESVPAYGTEYLWDYGGTVNAIDFQTGDIKWTWNTGSSGTETPYGVWPLWVFSVGTVADGKLYVPEGHMYSPPLFHGAKQLALDATTGDPIWSMLAFDVTSAPAIADGYMVTLNAYDNQIYCWGKGGSKITVMASPKVVPDGSDVVIEGRVTDESPGTKSNNLATRFPDGVPAVSDADMSVWMEYLYVQQPMPTNVQGVEVTLDAVDPNNNFIHIGTVTADMNGFYSYMWEPEHEGKYTVIATFEGSESYYSSYAETAVGVGPAPSAGQPMETEEPTTTPPPTEEPSTAPPTTEEPTAVPTEAPGITTEVVIVAAVSVIAVVGVAVYWVLRRQK